MIRFILNILNYREMSGQGDVSKMVAELVEGIKPLDEKSIADPRQYLLLE